MLKRENIKDIVDSISKEDRKQLRQLGIKIGRYHIFLPRMLKPKAVNLRISLWKFYNNISNNNEIPVTPPSIKPLGRRKPLRPNPADNTPKDMKNTCLSKFFIVN